MMAAVLLDTTVLIDLLRGRAGARGRLRTVRRAGDSPWICAVHVEEVARGLRPGEREAARRLLFGAREAALGAVEGWQAGEWRRDFASRGTTLSQADCLIAAAAHSLSGRLATGNPKHFPMPEVSVEHWPAGE